MSDKSNIAAPLIGIECGASSSTGLVVFHDSTTMKIKLEGGNFKLLSNPPSSLHTYFASIRDTLAEYGVTNIGQLAIGMPGILSEADSNVVKLNLQSIWPNLKSIWVGSDLETALACLEGNDYDVKLIIISGTGSGCFGTNGKITSKVGGYGHIIGDRGSGYSIAHAGLRSAVQEHDFNQTSKLLSSLLEALGLETVDELVAKVGSPEFSKADMASLAQVIFKACDDNDSVATKVVTSAIQCLVEDTSCLIRKLDPRENITVLIGLTGSIFTECKKIQESFIASLPTKLPPGVKVQFEILTETVRGALKMIGKPLNADFNSSILENPVEKALRALVLPELTSLSPTESRNPKSTHLDTMSMDAAMDLWLDEEKSFYDKIREQKPVLERIIKRVTAAFQNGGRLFYVGAGTSGRLGILDASECPPTFKTPAHWVQGIMAGGIRAIHSSVEGAEDSTVGGAIAIKDRNINSKDIVIGIASSGRTPFVWGALHQAKELKAFTCLLAFNPNMRLRHKPDEVIIINVGGEILTGSTRLKCGSATKCILNMITTLAMVRFGKCLENLMVDLNASNQKLKERALRIVLTILNSNGDSNIFSGETVHPILLKNNYDIKKTVEEFKRAK